MPIQILPARLANQIAAGEVVERPASVVKELVENSIDAGASRIEVDIDKGGHRLIRVRDNGSGIPKDELTLALSRHATSKITSLDDLEAIVSLGFRGEALASVSSVSRLTLTSRAVDAPEAWAAQAEGRDMAVQLSPAAHPVGSTVEVHDLFFNTPARRKFLKAEKTEFAHIDELMRRIALSRMELALVLRHNGKVVRQYPPARNGDYQARLAAVCGNDFARGLIAIDNSHQQLRLWGWLSEAPRNHPDLQYCYVNGRMMRDKLINHAVREAFGPVLGEGQHGAYVLYLELPASQVDVNVHPAKHEVRFHDARLVHDFIARTLGDALAQVQQALPEAQAEKDPWAAQPYSPPQAPRQSVSTGGYWSPRATAATSPSRSEVQEAINAFSRWQAPRPQAPEPQAEALGAPLHLEGGRWLVLGHKGRLCTVDLLPLWAQQAVAKMAAGAAPQPLLLPVTMPLEQALLDSAEQHQAQLAAWGLDLHQSGPGRLMVRALPAPLRELDPGLWLPGWLAALDGPEPLAALAAILGQCPRRLRWPEAPGLWQALDEEQKDALARPLDIQSLLEKHP
ncbi:DNA mismatch repair endonuclease MutL [Gallaecimonas kandeliae]|uniref:DNA mismatch repair endonuclease MutL n=1 Tax=Gallaecimonas kandeliae TaxID=3029055 RepID=UPI0026483C5B|nr:DNA mismatch repair endonuclease MutL [Gallaecimonas kandeliae]WKE64999.1 DNA mismatch repair endonuclease MutL [Gallaecimonas kandeliae]